MAYFLRVNPDAWTQDVAARDGNGTPVPALSPHARSWCMLGLIERFVGANPMMRDRVIELVEHAVKKKEGPWTSNIWPFNDTAGRNVYEVIDVFERAAQVAEPVIRRQPSDSINIADPNATITYQMKPAMNEALTLQQDVQQSLSKLVPWETIMKQLEREAA